MVETKQKGRNLVVYVCPACSGDVDCPQGESGFLSDRKNKIIFEEPLKCSKCSKVYQAVYSLTSFEEV
jgi:hypothetical protein